MQIVDSDHRNNLVKFEKDSLILFFSIWMVQVGSLESVIIFILLNIGMVKFLKTLHTVWIVKRQIFKNKYLMK